MISSEFGLHTPLLPIETKLQYLGLSLENAGFLAPLSFSQDLAAEVSGAKV